MEKIVLYPVSLTYSNNLGVAGGESISAIIFSLVLSQFLKIITFEIKEREEKESNVEWWREGHWEGVSPGRGDEV